MATLHTYLNFPGTAEEAFQFYRKVFGGEFLALQRFGETPGGDQLPEADRHKIMHIALPLGGGILMATDLLESMGQKLVPGNNYHLSLEAESEEEAHRLFQALSEGGEVRMPLQAMFWGALFGLLTDAWGIQWMMNYTLPKQP